MTVGSLASQLQTLGRAESRDRHALVDALDALNAQNRQMWQLNGVWVATCSPQPQDCGPLPEEVSEPPDLEDSIRTADGSGAIRKDALDGGSLTSEEPGA